MIKLFKPTDMRFDSNGDKIITPIKALVHKHDNGDFYLELEAGINFVDYLKPRWILVVPTPQGEQGFRISKIQKNRSTISVEAKHLFYDSANYLILNKSVIDQDCDTILKELNNSTERRSPFQVSSNINAVSSVFCTQTSLCDAIQETLKRVGGHLVRDNFNIEIRETIGQDTNIIVQYDKNSLSITSEENWGNVVTKLLPIGKDNILINHFDNSQDIYVTAPIQYEIPYTKIINFSPNIAEESFKNFDGSLNKDKYTRALVDDLNNQAEQYVRRNCIPLVNYTVQANINSGLDIGDTVMVIDKKIGIDITTQVVSFIYDCISKKYTQMEFGNSKKRAKDLIKHVVSECSNNVTTHLSNDMANKINVVRNSVIQEVQGVAQEVQGVAQHVQAIEQQKKHIITACVNANTNNLPEDVYTKIPLNHTIANSDVLKLAQNGIVIGSGIQWVKVSAIVTFRESETNGNRSILIAKNVIGQNNFFVNVTNFLTAHAPHSMVIPPKLIPVAENDVIWLIYYARDSSDIIRGNNNGNLTYMTVESIT